MAEEEKGGRALPPIRTHPNEDGPFSEIYADAVIGATFNHSTVNLLLAAEKPFFEAQHAVTHRVETGRLMIPTHAFSGVFRQMVEIMRVLAENKYIPDKIVFSDAEKKPEA